MTFERRKGATLPVVTALSAALLLGASFSASATTLRLATDSGPRARPPAMPWSAGRS